MSLTYEEADNRESPFGTPVSVISWAFTSDGDGDASEETVKIMGVIKRAVTIPDGDDTPTADWDLTIEDEDSVDVLCGNGADRDSGGTGAIEQAFPCPGNLAVSSTLTFKAANAGDSKKATVKLYIV
jgi:hypothetical protein